MPPSSTPNFFLLESNKYQANGLEYGKTHQEPSGWFQITTSPNKSRMHIKDFCSTNSGIVSNLDFAHSLDPLSFPYKQNCLTLKLASSSTPPSMSSCHVVSSLRRQMRKPPEQHVMEYLRRSQYTQRWQVTNKLNNSI